MDEVKAKIKEALLNRLTSVANKKNATLKRIDKDNIDIASSVIDERWSNIEYLVQSIEAEFKSKIDSKIETLPIKQRQLYKAEKWVKEGNGTWDDIAKACCISGKNRIESVRRKFKDSYPEHKLDDLELKRLASIGLCL